MDKTQAFWFLANFNKIEVNRKSLLSIRLSKKLNLASETLGLPDRIGANVTGREARNWAARARRTDIFLTLKQAIAS